MSSAVKAAYEESEKGKLWMLGEVVHNPIVIQGLISKNVEILSNIDKFPKNIDSKLLIRAHGVPKKIIDTLKQRKINFVDKTCPKVKRVHKIVENAHKRDNKVVIIGNKDHPEVIGINGWCDDSGTIFGSLDEVKQNVKLLEQKTVKLCVVAQTTYNFEKYQEICSFLDEKYENIEVHNTICNDTLNRQNEVSELSRFVDLIVIVGGKNSSNSTKLFEIAFKNCKYAQHIETESQIDFSNFSNIEKFALCSGASTPNTFLNNIIKYIKNHNQMLNIPTEFITL